MKQGLGVKVGAATVALMTALSGCATHSSNIAAMHASTLKYDGVDCRRLRGELDSVNSKLAALSASQDSSANGDAALMAVGLVLFWPALLALPATGGGKAQEMEIAQMKGEKEALEKAMLRCPQPAVVPVQTTAIETPKATPAVTAAIETPKPAPAKIAAEAPKPMPNAMPATRSPDGTINYLDFLYQN